MATIPSTGARRAKAVVLVLVVVAAIWAAQSVTGAPRSEAWSLQVAGMFFAAVMLDPPAPSRRSLVRGSLAVLVALPLWWVAVALVLGELGERTVVGGLVSAVVMVVVHAVVTAVVARRAGGRSRRTPAVPG